MITRIILTTAAAGSSGPITARAASAISGIGTRIIGTTIIGIIAFTSIGEPTSDT
jgi:hypothetical protein